MATTEEIVSHAILQQPENIKIGGNTYTFYPPSTATLILASEAISKLPKIKLNQDKLAEECLSAAKDCSIIGDVVAILLLGAKHIKETIKIPQRKEKRLFWGLFTLKYTKEIESVVDTKTELAKKLLEDLTPRELHNLTAQLLQRMQLADFFALTTFLTEINLLRQTKVEETTAFGQ